MSMPILSVPEVPDWTRGLPDEEAQALLRAAAAGDPEAKGRILELSMRAQQEREDGALRARMGAMEAWRRARARADQRARDARERE